MADRRPRLTWLEIELTYRCTLRCHNCNRLVNILPGSHAEDLTCDRIMALIRDSEACGYPWERWWLVGGEPTLHPELMTILRMISAYRDRRGPPFFQIGLATNGFTSQSRRIAAEVKRVFPHVDILDSKKTGPINPNFVAVCLAATDRGFAGDHVYDGCPISWHCGIAMNYRGFYPCAVSAAIDRIWDFQAYITRLEDITETRMKELWQVYCKVCGFYGEVKTEGSKTLVSRVWFDKLRERGITCEQIEVIGG